MLIHCPNCRRPGNLPDDLAMAAHTVRCRKCGSAFVTVPLRPPEESQAERPERQPHAARLMARRDTPFGTDLFSDDDNDNEDNAFDGEPGDSHYDLTAVMGKGMDDSQVELPAFSADDWPALEPGADSGSGPAAALPEPWYVRFIDSWGRYHAGVVLCFGGVSLIILSYFLFRPLLGGESVTSSTTALVVGCVGIIAFLLLSFTASAFYLLLLDLGRNMRQLNLQANRRPNSVADRLRDGQPQLSRTAV
jgi:hypothetical protein